MGRRKEHIEELFYPEWEQQPGESSASFAKFKVYRSLGVNRTVNAAARAIAVTPNLLVKEMQSLGSLSVKLMWTERVRKYEEYLA